MATTPGALSEADRRALCDLVGLYARAVDRRDFALLRLVFTDDATLDTGRGVRKGIDEILAVMQRLRRYEATFHLLGQQQVEGRGDAASGETYCDAHHLLAPTAEGAPRTDTVMKIRYLDEFVRAAPGWRIATRRLVTDWTEQRMLG